MGVCFVNSLNRLFKAVWTGCLRVFFAVCCLNRLFVWAFLMCVLSSFLCGFLVFFGAFSVEKRKVFKVYTTKYIMFGLFSRKKELEGIKEDTKKGFESVKKDIASVSGWIKHLDSEKNMQKKDVDDLKEVLSSIQNEIESMKNVLAMMNELKTNRVFKTPKQVFNKQTAVYAVQTGVQTGVQTPKLDQFSVTERAIVWILLNSDMKLSYDDLAAMLGKERSTIRGQINTIKAKSEGLIEEVIEENGKKRVFIPENVKERVLKKSKVRVKSNKNLKKTRNVSEY